MARTTETGWDRVIGQRRVKALLRRAIDAHEIAHAYLFIGPEGVGKDALALTFARALNCASGTSDPCGTCTSCRAMDTLRHPQLHLVIPLPLGKDEAKGDDPLQKLTAEQIGEIREQIRLKAEDLYHGIEIPKAHNIKINSVRDVRRLASLSSSGEGVKVFAMLRAETMNDEAANALLKTLEEPLEGTVLLLTAKDRDALPATIVSRCQVMQCDMLDETEIAGALVEREGCEAEQARLAAQMSNGSYSIARSYLSEDVQQQRSQTVDFLRTVLGRNRVELAAFVDAVASSYDRPGMERWLRLLAIWLHEAFLFREQGTLPPVGDAEALKKFVARYPQADLPGALASVERSIAHLNRFAYLPLLLTHLAVDLRTLIAGRSHA